MNRILIAEDDVKLLSHMVPALRDAGYRVTAVSRPDEAANLIRTGRFDVYILDWTFPKADLDGAQLLQMVRRLPRAAGVVFLTGRGAVMDKVQILSAGADDYLVKPFHLPELVARVHSVARRRRFEADTSDVVTFDDLVLDIPNSQLTIREESRDLSSREVQLLSYFLRRPGKTIGRSELIRDLWDALTPDSRSNTVDVHISRMRRLLGPYRTWLRTMHGTGYLFDPYQRPGEPEMTPAQRAAEDAAFEELEKRAAVELEIEEDTPIPGLQKAKKVKAKKPKKKVAKKEPAQEKTAPQPAAKKATKSAAEPKKLGRPKKSNA